MTRFAPHPFTLRQLQYVVAVAELRSFRRAAAACRVAQPSLSAQIAQLESVLGVILFERLPRGVLITEPGAAIIERARRVLLEADDLSSLAEQSRDPFAGTLRIGVIPTLAPYLLPEIAPALRSTYPRLQFLWVEEKTAPLVERIGEGALDAGLVALESDLSDLACESIAKDPFLLAVPPGHRLAQGRAPVSPAQLERETVLLLDDGHCFRDQALSVCQRIGAEEASMRATSLSTLAQMVAGGAGVTLLPASSARTENRARGLALRRLSGPGLWRTIALVWRKNAPASAALRSLATTLRAGVEPIIAAVLDPEA